MRVDFLHKTPGCRRLLLVFNGWSVPVPSPDSISSLPGYDIAVVSEYLDFRLPEVGRYDEVIVLAWSLGVHAAELALRGSQLPLTLTIAVNGTPEPISDDRGIPEAVFRATAERLTEQSLAKFRRRMGAANMERGVRPLEELREELLRFPAEKVDFRWDRAVISTDDRIFPPENQRKAWAGRTEITEIEGSHTPDFHDIVSRFVINKEHVGCRFARGRETYNDEASVQARMAGHLWELWRKHNNGETGGRILEIGVGSGLFTERYAPVLKPEELIMWDIAPSPSRFGTVVAADGETAVGSLASESLRAVASAATIQWFNSPAAFLRRVASALRPKGIAALSTFGPRTFRELSECGVVPLPYLSEESLRRIVPENMEILELHGGLVTKVFTAPMDALRHLRATGVNARPSAVGVRQIERLWPRRADGRVSLSFEPMYLILRKK